MEMNKNQNTPGSLEDRIQVEIEAFDLAKQAEAMGMEYETYKHLMSYENRLEPFREEDKIESNLVTKCQSTVYMTGDVQSGSVNFNAASDSAFVRGELGLVLSLFQGMTPEELKDEDTKNRYVQFCSELSDYVKLSINRAQGLEGIYEKMVEIVKKED